MALTVAPRVSGIATVNDEPMMHAAPAVQDVARGPRPPAAATKPMILLGVKGGGAWPYQ